MSGTTRQVLAESSWTQVATGPAHPFIVFEAVDEIYAYVGASAPLIGETNIGWIKCQREPIDMDLVPAGLGLWLRAVNGSAVVAVLDTGPGPGEISNLVVSGTVTSAAVLFTQDVSAYEQFSVQLTDVGGGNTILFEGSNDNVNWYSLNVVPISSTGNAASFSGVNGLGIYRGNVSTKLFRARCSAYVSGNAAATAMFKAEGDPLMSAYVNGISGNAAHSAASSGNPVRVAGRVNTAVDTTLAAGDACDIFMTASGQQVVKDFADASLDWQSAAGASGIVNTTTAVMLKAAGAAGVRNYLTGLTIAHDTLSAVTELVIRDGAAGTVIYRTKLQTTAKEDTNVVFPTPLRGTAATLMEVALLTAVTGGVYVNAQGFQAA